VVIPASSNAAHVRENLNFKASETSVVIGQKPRSMVSKLFFKAGARDRVKLSEDDMKLIATIDRKKRRAPDLIGMWPSQATTAARIFGGYVLPTLLFPLPYIWPVNVAELRRYLVLLCGKREKNLRNYKMTNRVACNSGDCFRNSLYYWVLQYEGCKKKKVVWVTT